MKHVNTRMLRLALAGAVAAGTLFINDHASVSLSTWVTQAQAIIGRPLTPLSYAGVARRTTRRAVVAGAAVGAAAAQPVYVAPACAQHVDAYGRIYYACP